MPESDPVDSLLLAARGAADYARQRAVSSGASAVQLAPGDSVRRIADSLTSLDRKAEAAVLLTTAASFWEQSERQNRVAPGLVPPSRTGRGTQGAAAAPAASVTGRDPPETPTARADSAAVVDYFSELAGAIASRQLGEVRRLLPNMTPNEERNWRSLFDDRDVDSISARFSVLNITRRESLTYARVRYSQAVAKRGRSQDKARTFIAVLTMGPQGWRQIREESIN